MVGDVGGDAPAVARGNRPVRAPSVLHAGTRGTDPGHRKGAKRPQGSGVGASVNQVLTRVFLLQVGIDDEEGHNQPHKLQVEKVSRRSRWSKEQQVECMEKMQQVKKAEQGAEHDQIGKTQHRRTRQHPRPSQVVVSIVGPETGGRWRSGRQKVGDIPMIYATASEGRRIKKRDGERPKHNIHKYQTIFSEELILSILPPFNTAYNL